jgi:hypothetical protein
MPIIETSSNMAVQIEESKPKTKRRMRGKTPVAPDIHQIILDFTHSQETRTFKKNIKSHWIEDRKALNRLADHFAKRLPEKEHRNISSFLCNYVLADLIQVGVLDKFWIITRMKNKAYKSNTGPKGPFGPKSQNLIETSKLNFAPNSNPNQQISDRILQKQLDAAKDYGEELHETDTDVTNYITFLLERLTGMDIDEAEKLLPNDLLKGTNHHRLEMIKRWTIAQAEITLKALYPLNLLFRELTEMLESEVNSKRRNREMLST